MYGVQEVSLSDDEYLVTISGTVGVFPDYYPDQQLVTSITFVSNKRRHGPYGDGGGAGFSLPLEGGRIAGLFGRCGEYLDAIGVNVVSSGSQLGAALVLYMLPSPVYAPLFFSINFGVVEKLINLYHAVHPTNAGKQGEGWTMGRAGRKFLAI